MRQWKTLDRTCILDHGKFLKIEKHRIKLPDGRIMEDWPWIVSPDFVLVVPVTERGTLLLFNQVKYAVKGTSLAPIGGYIEPREDPLTAAKRELKEEMGCEAEKWMYFGGNAVNGNHGGGTGHLFTAFNTRKCTEICADDLEEMEMLELSPEEVEERLFSGEIKVQGWLAVIAVALLYLKKAGNGSR
jgi:ADP-ribose pyrophosphatase